MLSAGPPATRRGAARAPAAVTSATHSSVPSHGISGWSQLSQESRRPSGLRRGAAKKSWPETRTARRSRAVGGHGDELVGHHVALVSLAHADQRAPVRGHGPVGVAQGARSGRRRGDGPRFRGDAVGLQVDAVEALVLELAPDHGRRVAGAPHRVHAAAVLVHERARVATLRRDVGDRTVRRAPHDDVAPALERPHLHPEQRLARRPQEAEADARFGDEVGGDRRAPRAVRPDHARVLACIGPRRLRHACSLEVGAPPAPRWSIHRGRHAAGVSPSRAPPPRRARPAPAPRERRGGGWRPRRSRTAAWPARGPLTERPPSAVWSSLKPRRLVANSRTPPGASRRRAVMRMRSAWSRCTSNVARPMRLELENGRRIEPDEVVLALRLGQPAQAVGLDEAVGRVCAGRRGPRGAAGVVVRGRLTRREEPVRLEVALRPLEIGRGEVHGGGGGRAAGEGVDGHRAGVREQVEEAAAAGEPAHQAARETLVDEEARVEVVA